MISVAGLDGVRPGNVVECRGRARDELKATGEGVANLLSVARTCYRPSFRR